MAKIIEYYIAAAQSWGELEEAVNAKIEMGWQPYGSIADTGKSASQAMVKYAEEPKSHDLLSKDRQELSKRRMADYGLKPMEDQ